MLEQTKKQVKVIKPTAQNNGQRDLRVAAYCRVSTDSEDQSNSFLAQVKYYTDFISNSANMVLVDIYADEGITGTCVNKRDEFLRMIKDCKIGKIDKIFVKSVSRFARNSLECIENIRILKECNVTVIFEECKLHDAICRAISSAIPEKGEILSAIKSTLEYAETGDENSLNIFNYEQNIAKKKEEAKRIMLLMTTTEGDTEKYEKAISKIYDEIRVLREELDTARKQLDINVDLSAEIKRLTEIFERDDLNFKEFDDCVIRRITECIRVMGDKSIIITLKGGFELREKI